MTSPAEGSPDPGVANVEMAAAWDGAEGDHWADHAARYEATSSRYQQSLLRAASISGGEAILDVGCGTGGSTREVARLASSGSALGIDLSTRMLERARAAASVEGLTNVRFERGDAQVFPFPDGAFDLAISAFGAMFFADPVAAFANIAGSLRPQGNLALLGWRELPRNEWLVAIRDALSVGRELPMPPPGVPGPFGLADEQRTERILTEAGFVDIDFEEVAEPLRLGDDADHAFSFVSTFGITRGLTQDLDEVTRAAALEALHATLAQHQSDDGVLFGASAWLITARAASAPAL